MSVYRPKNSPYYAYDFWSGGVRFHGPTKTANRREAEAIEREARACAFDAVKLSKRARSPAGLTIDIAAGRYWHEVGQHHTGSKTTWRDLERLIKYFGKDKLLYDITDDDVAILVARRRGDTVRRIVGDKVTRKPISNATINRSTTEVLKKLFTRARGVWRIDFTHEPRWSDHMLSEPQEMVRELHLDEAQRLDAAMTVRDDYEPFFAFARASGFRLNECLLRWSEVNWQTMQIVKPGKGGRRVSTPITPAILAIIVPLQLHHPEMVFTYIDQRLANGKKPRVVRRPITYQGAKSRWRRLRKAARLIDFRFHDFRHDLASRLLRETGNLKIVQRALNHSDLKTTTKYAHVQDSEVADALRRIQKLAVIKGGKGKNDTA